MSQASSVPTTIQLYNRVELPAIGLGTFKARGKSLKAIVACALHCGIRHIDTASVYKNESEIADALEASDVPREDIFITSKIGPTQQGTDKAQLACEEVLQRLRIDYVDLVLIHWPGVAKMEVKSTRNATKRLESWRVLETFYRSGRCGAIGVSNYEQHHLQELLDCASVKPMVNQIEVHPRYPQRELRDFCKQHSIAVVAYASLGCGDLLSNSTVQHIAQACDRTSAQVLLRWGLQQECAVIPKTVHEDYLQQYTEEQLLTWKLSSDQLQALDAMDDAHKYCWNPAPVR